MATFQPASTPPSAASSGTKASSRKTSAKPSSPSSRSKPRTVTPVGVERHQEVGEAAVALGLRIGAEQAEQVGAEGAAGGPGLLPGEPPAARRLVAHRAALGRGQVAAGAGLRPALAPEVLGRRHPRQDPVLLLGGAELEQGRGEQEDPVLGDPLAARRPGSTPPRRSATPRSRRRGRRRPRARTRRPSAPRAAASPTRGAGRSPRRVSPEARPPRDVGLEPLARLGAEGLLGIAVGEVHPPQPSLPKSSRTLSATPERFSSKVKPCS